MLFNFKSIKSVLSFAKFTPSKSDWVADKAILKVVHTGVEVDFATPVQPKETYLVKEQVLNSFAKDWKETNGGRIWFNSTVTPCIHAVLNGLNVDNSIAKCEIVVDTRVFQAVLSEKGLKTVELFVDTDHKRWGFKTPTGILISEGEYQDVSTLEEGVRVQYEFIHIEADGSRLQLNNWELADIVDACPQAEDIIKEDDTRTALTGIYFTKPKDKWVAQSTDGRTLTEWNIKTQQVGECKNILLRGDTLALFKGFEKVEFIPGKVQVIEQDSKGKRENKECQAVKVILTGEDYIVEFETREVNANFPDFNRVIPTGTPYNITLDRYNVEAICDLYYDSFAGTGYKNLKAGRVDNLQIYFKEVNNYLEVEIRQGGLKHGDVPVKVRNIELSVNDLPKDLYIHFNAKFLVNLLYAIGHEDGNGYLDVNFGYEKEFSPVALSSELGTAVVMPLKDVTD